MSNFLPPQAGTRFSLQGAHYEITFVQFGNIRYASSAGGKVFRVPIAQFEGLLSTGKICIEHQATDNGIICDKSILRKRRYIEAALTGLPFPGSKKQLKLLIPKVADLIKDLLPPCASTLAVWIKQFREKGDSGIFTKKNSGNTTLQFDPLVEQLMTQAISSVYLSSERRDANSVRDEVIGKAMEMGLLDAVGSTLKIPSVRTIQRRISQIDPYVTTRARQGELAAQRYVRASGKKIVALFALASVEIDTHYLDILIIDPDTGEVLGRPYLICIIDVKTRVVVGTHLSLYPPSAVTSLAALKDMLLKYGIPSQIITDNGVEIKNTSFAFVCETLCIIINRAQIREPDNKPHIESFFRTLTYAITQKMPGTTFSNVSQRANYNSEKEAAFTLAQVSTLIEQWIENVYHITIHTRTGRAPILDWRDSVKTVKPMVLTENEVDKLIRRPVTRNIHSGRVLINYIEYYSHALAIHEGESVIVLVDDLNLHYVFVKHPSESDTLILAESTDPEYTLGLNSYVHEEAKKIRKELTAGDIAEFGKNGAALSRYLLMKKINTFAKEGRKFKKKTLNGGSRVEKAEASRAQAQIKTQKDEPMEPLHIEVPENEDNSSFESMSQQNVTTFSSCQVEF